MNVIQEFTELRRERFSLSQAAVILGTNKGTLQQIESGKRKCPPQVLGKMVTQVMILQHAGNGQASQS